MATLNYTGGSAGAPPPNVFSQHAVNVTLYKRVTVADVIAADATMTTNNLITDADIIHILHASAGLCINHAISRVITTTATGDWDWGDYLVSTGAVIDDDGFDAAVDASAAAGTVVLADGDYLPAAGPLTRIYTANSYISLTLETANMANDGGDMEFFLMGWQLLLGS